jgi:hypothetical protein
MKKAKIRKTGEIVNIICFNCTTRRCKYDSVSYIDSKGAEHVEEPLNYYWDFEEIPNLDATINWEQRRYELAKELLKILISKPNETCFIEERLAIKRADKLIEILKED